MDNSTMKRELRIDIMRVIGTLLVILAHINIPDSIMQIRCFDVVMLVFISGYCTSSFIRLIQYLKKRFCRLVLPTWITLLFLFGITYLACCIIGRPSIYSFEKIVRSFIFANGSIGFIWIVRVYLVIAVIMPLIIKLDNHVRSDFVFFLLIATALVSGECIYKLFEKSDFTYYLIEGLNYTAIAALGYRCKKERNKLIFWSAGVSLSAFLIWCFANKGFTPNFYKYPPQIPYVLYGISVTLFVFTILRQSDKWIIPSILKNVVYKISALSFDVYLIHILVLSALNLMLDYTKISVHWTIQYLVVIITSLICSAVITKIRQRVLQKIGNE